MMLKTGYVEIASRQVTVTRSLFFIGLKRLRKFTAPYDAGHEMWKIMAYETSDDYKTLDAGKEEVWSS
jgi:hypothetical protein